MSASLRVMCIEDSEDDIILLTRNLRREGLNPVLKQVTNADEMRAALELSDWDVIICDYLMPDFDIQGALEILHDSSLDIPFIIVSGSITDEAAVRMMKMGAHDYILKDNLSRLAPAIRRELEEAHHREEKRKTQEAFVESETKYRTLVNSIRDIVFVLDENGVFSEYYSSEGFGMLGRPDEIVGNAIPDATGQQVARLFTQAIVRVLGTKCPMTFEFPLESDRTAKWYSASMNPHEDRQRVVVVLRDISDLKSIESNLRASYRLANLYLDIMGHDIRNHLQAMLISTELLGDSATGHSEAELLEQLNTSIQKCNDIIVNIQATKDLLSTKLERVDMCRLVEECVDEFGKSNESVEMNVDCEPDEAEILADSHLSTMIMNMLKNAVKHNLNGDVRVWIQVRRAQDGYELSVADNGPGISDSKKEVLLDPDRRFGGVGIHQSKQIAEKYGGRFMVGDREAGNPTGGAKFSVWLPKAEVSR
jgi:PAS domain S-box-containing protein